MGYFQNFVAGSFIGVAIIVSSCSSNGITSHSVKTKGVDLKKYKTYAWLKPADAEEEVRKDDKLYGKLILQLCNEELSKKGFVLDTENPDALFMFDTHVEDRVAYSTTPQVNVGIGFGGPGYYGGVYAPVAGGDLVQHNFQEGMMLIEMYETKTQKLLWKGYASKKITYESDVEADIRTATKHIFMRLGVKHK